MTPDNRSKDEDEIIDTRMSEHEDDAQDAPGEFAGLKVSAGDDSEEESENLPATTHHIDRYVESFQQFVERCGHRFDAISEYIAPSNKVEEKAPENLARGPIVFGSFLMFLIFGVFGLWSVLAPIDSAAIAQGKVVLDSNRKTIDHFEGGIVEEILVQEGMIVKEGQPLIRLDDTAARARLDLYTGQFVAAQATEARLLAERDNAEYVSFPDALLEKEKDDPNIAANLDAQRRLFAARRESVNGKIDVLKQKIKQHEEEIKGLEEQIKSSNTQLALLEEEITDVKKLLKQGNATKTRLLALERRQAEIVGEKGERQALISRAHQSINEAKIEMFNLKTEFLNQVVAELKETQGQLSDLEEQLRAAQDVVQRIVIKAPITGEVTGLKAHTVGGVITASEPIMDIVPSEDKLIVEAKVNPQDIDVVRKGLTARVRLSAFKVRNVPPVEGELVTVSADRFDDQRTGESYYTARIEISDEQLSRLGDVELTPGMPAEVLIVTGSRTLFAYLTSPISDSFNRSFREQ